MPDNLKKYADAINITEFIDDDELAKIGQEVVRDFKIDMQSCQTWMDQNKEAIKLAKQVKEEKSFPWPNAANVKYPLITTASIQFAARAYPEIVQGNDVVKAKVVGKDPTGQKQLRADRVARHMSYQLTDEMEDWEENTDKLLHVLPIIGCLFKKTYYDSEEARTCSYFYMPDDVVINYRARSIATARRISHRIFKYENDIYENVTRKIWSDEELGLPPQRDGDSDTPHEFIEQHRFVDLDGDGYKEPYIVTVHLSTGKVVRIVARFRMENVEYKGSKLAKIKPDQYFTQFDFLPNPDGGLLGIGFGALLLPINESVNTVLNELLDAGALSNAGGGFIGRGVRIKGGKMTFQLGEWKVVEVLGTDLRNQIVPKPSQDPSNTLFLLLGTLIDAGKDISNVKDVLVGEKPGENVSAELFLGLVEQGLKVFTGIYKRIYRSLTKEFKKLFWLNSIYLDEQAYFNILDEEEARTAYRSDYNLADCDVRPVANPDMSLDIQRLAKQHYLMQIRGTNPRLNDEEILNRYFNAGKIEDTEKLWMQGSPPPNPEIEKLYLEMGIMRDKHRLETLEIMAGIRKTLADAVLSIAKAEAQEVGPQIEEYKASVQQLGMMLKHHEAMTKNEEGRNPKLAEGPTNEEGDTGGPGTGGSIQ